MIGVTCLLIPLGVIIGNDTSPVELRWRLNQGEKLHFEWQVTVDAVSTVSKVVKKITNKQAMEFSWQVEGRDEEGNYRIAQKLERLQWKLFDADGREVVTYDSASDNPQGQARELHKLLGPLIGQPVQLALSPRGEIVSAAPSPEFQRVIEQMKNQESLLFAFSAEGLTQMFRQSLPLLPSEAVSAGSQWEQTSRYALAFGNVTQKNRYTLTQIATPSGDSSGDPAVTIDVTSELQWQPAPQQSLQLKEQHMQGKLLFDIRRGRLVRATVEQTLVTEDMYRDDKIVSRTQTKMEVIVR